MRATAVACSNVALVKYWGKREARPELNLPAVGSLSITLAALTTKTTVELRDGASADTLVLSDPSGILRADAGALERVTRHVDRLRAHAGVKARVEVVSHNDFPTGAGLASSASGFAALTLAAARALGIELSVTELSVYARMGSGSAARSLFGGFVEMARGELPGGEDAFARMLAPPEHWPLDVVVAITSLAQKSVGSTAGMQRRSPFWSGWIGAQQVDLDEARAAIGARDFERLARVTEHSCLKLHALAMSSSPPLVYWHAATLAVIERVRELQKDGVPVCFTIDAGPQVKAVCLPEATPRVREALAEVPGVESVIVSGLGGAARVA
jgi:diphosphomevalonate decarboxylase